MSRICFPCTDEIRDQVAVITAHEHSPNHSGKRGREEPSLSAPAGAPEDGLPFVTPAVKRSKGAQDGNSGAISPATTAATVATGPGAVATGPK